MPVFTPTNPEELVSFESVLAEYNEIHDLKIVFTDDYMVSWDVYVGSETTADGYDVTTIVCNGESIDLERNVYMYSPDAYDIFSAIHESDTYEKCVVYVDDLDDKAYDIEEYMREELRTNFINYLDENELEA